VCLENDGALVIYCTEEEAELYSKIGAESQRSYAARQNKRTWGCLGRPERRAPALGHRFQLLLSRMWVLRARG